MQEIEEQMTQARGLAEELTAYSEAFQFIVTVADHYADRPSGWFAKWMSVTPRMRGPRLPHPRPLDTRGARSTHR